MSPYFFPGVSPVLFPTSVLRTVVSTIPGGDEGNRTLDPLLARQVLSHLSYIPIPMGKAYMIPGNRTAAGFYYKYFLTLQLPLILICL